ncbi:hypothetical protein ACQRWP_07470 [Micromonospora trifolii]|uniref:hypothetical protein n=1 Tax=Micromonospora trifolii TaxID=2911208 RepID=UPI003D2ECA63
MRGRRRPWSLLPLPLLLLTACSPPDEPLVALAVKDGQPVGVLVTCQGDHANIHVYEDSDEGGRGTRTLSKWGVYGATASEVVEVTLLGQPPEGWEDFDALDSQMSEVEVAPLTEFRPGVTYTVIGSGRHHAISVDFALADLPRVGPDQVLAPRGHDSTTVVSRETFLRKARDRC